jgi:hypothetical protein
VSLEHCARCGQPFARRTPFQFQTSSGVTRKCLRCAARHVPMVWRSALIALIVGTVLTAINQGDVLFTGQVPIALLWKLPLTYAVPFVVATLGAMMAAKVPHRE